MIKVKHGNFKDCALRVPYPPTSQVVKVTDSGKSWFFACVQGGAYEIAAILAKSLAMRPENPVLLEFVQPKPCLKVEVEPADEDSWELISCNTEFIENGLLGQIRVVQNGIMLPIWIENCCAWIRIIDVEGGWGLLQKNSEIMVKPKERKRKLDWKELRAIGGSLELVTNEFPDQSVVACIREKCFVIGFTCCGDIRDGHVSGKLLEKFVRYQVHRVFPVQENVVCFLNKFSLEVKVAQAEFLVSSSEEEFTQVVGHGKIVIYDGMVIENENFKIQVSIKTQINTQEWIGFVLISDTSLITFVPPSALAKPVPTTLKLPSFVSFCKEVKSELDISDTVIIEGAPGVGKTSCITLLSSMLEDDYIGTVVLSCRQFPNKEFIGKLSEAIELAETKVPCVLIIDDLEQVCGKLEDLQMDQSKLISCQSCTTLLSYLDKNHSSSLLKFLFICKHKSYLNNLISTSSYLTTHFSTPPLSHQDIFSIFSHFFPDIPTDSLLSQVKSFTISDLINFCKLCKLQLTPLTSTSETLLSLLKEFTPQALEKKENLTKTSWEQIGGLFAAKEKVLEAFQFPVKFSILYENYPLKLRSGMLLYGPPGCGKTFLSSAIPSICEMATICVKGPELLNKYIGASEQAVREVFERAKRVKPSAIIFDEFEAIVPKRGSGSTAVTDRIVNQFLCELDGVESRGGVYVIAISSRPELIDPALLRPGRLDFHVYCPFPNSLERADILKVLCGKLGITIDYEKIAEIMQGYTGADIQGLMNNLQIKLAHGQCQFIHENDFLEEFKSFSSSFGRRQREEYEERYLKFANKKNVDGVGKKTALI